MRVAEVFPLRMGAPRVDYTLRMHPVGAKAIRNRMTTTCKSLLIVSTALLVGCGGGEEPATAETPAVELPTELVVENPTQPIAVMELFEDYSEEVANRFIEFADKLRRRDFQAARAWLASDFAGHSLHGLQRVEALELPLAAHHDRYDAQTAAIVGPDDFLASCAAWLGPWERVENVEWKVKGAEFQTGRPTWGKIHFRVTMLGDGPADKAGGGPRAVVAWGDARVERRDGEWLLTQFQLESIDQKRRAAPLFTDVASAVGVAHAGIRFGQRGNQSFAWNGAAGGDVDGDGLWDLFVPSEPANFLYLGAVGPEGELIFEDQAAARGVREPAGGTGAAFFDYDNDGDQDLALAGVGWKGGGHRLRLWRSDGHDEQGKFEEVGGEVGFGDICHGYSITVFDAEGDGFLDVYVCNYGRIDVDPNNSWIQATNGTPDRLYHNVDGERFEEVAKERGLVDTSWTYAAAAADFDQDGDMDLYVANDYGRNLTWLNDGAGRFSDGAEALGITDPGNGMGVSWGDLDSDGVLDLYVSNMSSTAGNRILKRLAQKDGRWSELSKLAAGNTIFLAAPGSDGTEGSGGGFRALPAKRGGIGGSWAWGSALVDLDLDGRLDVYCCSGFVTGDTPADT